MTRKKAPPGRQRESAAQRQRDLAHGPMLPIGSAVRKLLVANAAQQVALKELIALLRS
jgi:hypothetical protein